MDAEVKQEDENDGAENNTSEITHWRNAGRRKQRMERASEGVLSGAFEWHEWLFQSVGLKKDLISISRYIGILNSHKFYCVFGVAAYFGGIVCIGWSGMSGGRGCWAAGIHALYNIQQQQN